MKLNKIRKQIPSLRVSKDLLIELCGILEKEYQSKKPEKEPAIYGLTYKFSNRDVSIQENKSKLFVENVPETIGDIKLSLELEDASIEVTIKDTRYYDWNTFSISGLRNLLSLRNRIHCFRSFPNRGNSLKLRYFN